MFPGNIPDLLDLLCCGDFLEIFYKLTEIPAWSVTPNIQHMLLKKYEAPEGGPTVLYK